MKKCVLFVVLALMFHFSGIALAQSCCSLSSLPAEGEPTAQISDESSNSSQEIVSAEKFSADEQVASVETE